MSAQTTDLQTQSGLRAYDYGLVALCTLLTLVNCGVVVWFVVSGGLQARQAVFPLGDNLAALIYVVWVLPCAVLHALVIGPAAFLVLRRRPRTDARLRAARVVLIETVLSAAVTSWMVFGVNGGISLRDF